MHDESERDFMLIQLWRSQVETRLGVYNVEPLTHQCLHASPPQIVRPFVCAPHFYGCLVCGREHRCYADPRLCEPIVDPADGATVSCQYSGAVLPTVRPATTFVGTYNEQQIAKDNGGITLEKYLAGHSASETQSRRIFRPHKPMLYSNIRVYLPRPTANEQQQRPTRRPHHREKQHPLIERTDSTSKTPGGGGDEDAEMSVEVEEGGTIEAVEAEEEVWDQYEDDDGDDDDIECGTIHHLDSAAVSYTNEQYWNARFDFLTLLTGSGVALDQVEFSGQMPNEGGGGGVQTAPHFDQALMNDGLRTEISRSVSRLIDHLVMLQLGGQEHKNSATELTHFFTPRVEAIVLLLYNSPVMANLVAAKQVQLTKHAASITTVARTIRHEYVFDESGAASVLTVGQICEALLLQLFTEDYCDEDQCNNRIVIWHRSHWLAHLVKCRVVEAFFGECSPAAIGDADDSGKRKAAAAAPSARKKRRLDPALAGGYPQCTRKQLKKSVAVIRDCLVHYKGHGLWLRHFILDHGKS